MPVTSAIGRVNIRDREYFKPAPRGRIFLSEALVSGTTGNPILIIAVPVDDGSGVIGVLFGSVNMSLLNETFDDSVQFGKKDQTFMFASAGGISLIVNLVIILISILTIRPPTVTASSLEEGASRFPRDRLRVGSPTPGQAANQFMIENTRHG